MWTSRSCRPASGAQSPRRGRARWVRAYRRCVLCALPCAICNVCCCPVSHARTTHVASFSAGLPARRDVVDALRQQQLGVLRMGGTMCNVEGYRWCALSLALRHALCAVITAMAVSETALCAVRKYFRGPREQRDPYHGYWCAANARFAAALNSAAAALPDVLTCNARVLAQVRGGGADAVARVRHVRNCGPVPGAGQRKKLMSTRLLVHPPEHSRVCPSQAIDCEPVITLNYNETPSDMAGA
jgi:hypothetical protein